MSAKHRMAVAVLAVPLWVLGSGGCARIQEPVSEVGTQASRPAALSSPECLQKPPPPVPADWLIEVRGKAWDDDLEGTQLFEWLGRQVRLTEPLGHACLAAARPCQVLVAGIWMVCWELADEDWKWIQEITRGKQVSIFLLWQGRVFSELPLDPCAARAATTPVGYFRGWHMSREDAEANARRLMAWKRR